MKRAPYLAAVTLATSLVMATALTSTAGCNDVETKDAPDASPRACNAGPFVFNADGQPSLPLPNEQTANTCSGDGTGQPVIERLPRGGRYGVDWKVQLVGSRDLQGDCEVITVCTCYIPTVATPTPAPVDAGPDADPDAAAPPPPPETTPGVPTWRCE